MSLELIGKFIGPDEIESADVSELKTPEGKDIVEVTFKSKRKKIYPSLALDYIVTNEASDHNNVQFKKFTPVIREFMKIVAEYDVSVGEIEALMRNLATNIDNTFNRATNYLWTKDDKRFAPGFDPMYEVSLLQAHRVITNIKDESTE